MANILDWSKVHQSCHPRRLHRTTSDLTFSSETSKDFKLLPTTRSSSSSSTILLRKEREICCVRSVLSRKFLSLMDFPTFQLLFHRYIQPSLYSMNRAVKNIEWSPMQWKVFDFFAAWNVGEFFCWLLTRTPDSSLFAQRIKKSLRQICLRLQLSLKLCFRPRESRVFWSPVSDKLRLSSKY